METLDEWLKFLKKYQPQDSWDPACLGLALAREEYPQLEFGRYLSLLDGLADEVQRFSQGADGMVGCHWALLQVVWDQLCLRGNTTDYYDPRNSFINDVLDRKLGIPISMALVWAALGFRLNWPVSGLAFPGHVMIGLGSWNRKSELRDFLVLDPFQPGEPLDQSRLDDFFQQLIGADRGGVCPTADWEMKPVDWLTRMLLNLRGIYLKQRDYPRLARTLGRLVSLQPDEPALSLELGYAWLGAHQPGKAATVFQDLLNREPAGSLKNQAEAGLSSARKSLALFN